MPISVAIVGSGPAAFYTAATLVDSDDDVLIDIIERLPTPYGLIRDGVAPDHQTTKRVSRAFAKTLQSDGVRFLGNIEVGREASIEELQSIYDAVVLAYGAPYDNRADSGRGRGDSRVINFIDKNSGGYKSEFLNRHSWSSPLTFNLLLSCFSFSTLK